MTVLNKVNAREELSVDCERNWLKEMEAEKKFEEKKKDLKKPPQMKTKVKKLFPKKEWLEKLNFAWKQSLKVNKDVEGFLIVEDTVIGFKLVGV